MKIKNFFLCLLLCANAQLMANTVKPNIYTIEDDNNKYLYVYQTTTGAAFNSLTTLYSDSISNVYVPIINTLASNRIHSSATDPNELSKSTEDGYIRVDLTVSTTTNSVYYLNASYEDPDSPGTYLATPFIKTRKLTTDATPDTDFHSFNSVVTDQVVTAYLNIKNLCEGDCELNSSTKSIKVYFFLTPDSPLPNLGTPATPSDYAGGATIQFNLSDKFPNYATTLDPLRKGDGRLIGKVTSTNIPDGHEIVNYFVKGADHTGETFTDLNDLKTTANAYTRAANLPFTYSGDVVFDNLVNGATYTFSVALINKYQFSTIPSPAQAGSPESIETFLQSQQCYLLSAGFQEEHYIIDYFKGIRDQYLLKNWAGTLFVKFYYWSAPKVTHYIYESSILSAIFRGFGYSLYFIFNYYLIVLALIISLVSLIFLRQRTVKITQ